MSISKIFNFRLSKKLPLLIVMFAFITAIEISYLAYKEAKIDLTEVGKDTLFSTMKNKSNELTGYLNSLESDMKFMSSAVQTKKALLDFKSGFDQIGGNQKRNFAKTIYYR